MTKQYLLAHDLGTSGNKACIFDLEGTFLAEAYYPIKTYYPEVGWAEQRPEDWWTAIKESTHEVLHKSNIRKENLCAISFSSHGMTAIPLDKNGDLLQEQVMTWMDARSTSEAAHILSNISERERYEKTGNSFDIALYPSSKLLWMKRNTPDIYNRAVKFLNPKEYLAYKMTGIYGNTDYGEAGMSGLYNMNTHSWDEELLRISEIDEEKLLTPTLSTTPVGTLTKKAADELGLDENTLVILGSWDNYACALGGGVRKAGTFVTCMGTAGWVGVTSKKPLVSEKFMSNVVYMGDGTYFTSVHSHSACVAYEWVLSNMCADIGKQYGKKVYEQITDMAAQAGAGADGVFFLPSMFSGNTFYSDAKLSGSFLGIRMHHNKNHLLRAAMEGPAFDLMMGVDFFKMMGVMSKEARLIGGGANNDLWMQILADMFDVQMMRPKNIQHIGALGASLIAGVGAGLIDNLDAANDIIQIHDSKHPQVKDRETYRKLLPKFKQFYECLLPAYRSL